MDTQKLEQTANALVADHKGILAADESVSTLTKRFEAIATASTEESRRAWRHLLFTTPEMEKYISGVILYDETMRQGTDDGVLFPELLRTRGILPGIKVDSGAHDFAHFPHEKITEGLDGLRARLADYAARGALFTKWRAVITIGLDYPTEQCIRSNAEALARYAALAQDAGLVPIVEPEVLMDGQHSLARCEAVTSKTLDIVFHTLEAHRVYLPGILLKPNMVVPGRSSGDPMDIELIAEATVRTFNRVVPQEVPGIVFLSGGQTPQEAIENLAAIAKRGPHPWIMTFSYGRALQEDALKAWGGKQENINNAQAAFLARARSNSAATAGDVL